MSNKINQEFLGKLDDEFETCLKVFESSVIFPGPSVYFHQKALARRTSFQTLSDALHDDLFFDYLYATLASWGMHRMGSGGAKLCEMGRFRESIERQKIQIIALQDVKIAELRNDQLPQVSEQVWEIIQNLEAGTQSVKIVVGSKVLHHILPELVPPIDREYTLNFFYGNKNINRPEKAIFLELFPQFHHLAMTHKSMIARMISRGGCMNTSTTKVIDNAIVGYVLKNIKIKSTQRQVDHPSRPPIVIRSYLTKNNQTHADKILDAARSFYNKGRSSFTRDDVRRYLNLTPEEWLNGYTAIFQGMREDHPGGAPKVGKRYQKVFKQISHGVYTLTEKGKGAV